jgi:UDP-glucose 4-epimerase
MNILVLGGAGYIGSHVVRELERSGFTPVIYDNLETGTESFTKGYQFINGDIGDPERLKDTIYNFDISCVMNFASYITVGESVSNPLKYYEKQYPENKILLKTLKDCSTMKFIFSSSAAIYGIPESIPVTEDSPKKSINPYGHSKNFIEQILDDMDQAYGFRSICFRYFNAAGADPAGDIGEKP